MKKRFVSLFSGAGGMDQGFISAGWKPALMTDFWKPAVDTLITNHPGTQVHEWDLSTVSDKMLLDSLELQGLMPRDISCVTGGPPCQPFSRLNQNQLFEGNSGREMVVNMNDPRRSLFMDFLRIVRCLQPSFVVMENVADLKTRKLGGVGPERNELIKNIILKEFDLAGYNVAVDILLANEYDVPQLRRRIIFIGVRKDLKIQPIMPPKLITNISVRSEFSKIKPHHPNQELKRHSDEWLIRARLIPPGGYYVDLPLEHKVLKPVDFNFVSSYDGQSRQFCIKHSSICGHHMPGFWEVFHTSKGPNKVVKIGDHGGVMTMKRLAQHIGGGCELFRIMPRMGTYLRRIRWDVSHTVTRNPLIHPEEHREITVREKAAIQTFPPEYIFKGKRQDQHVLIGNAVPCNLGREIAKHIVRMSGWQR